MQGTVLTVPQKIAHCSCQQFPENIDIIINFNFNKNHLTWKFTAPWAVRDGAEPVPYNRWYILKIVVVQRANSVHPYDVTIKFVYHLHC